MTASSNGRAETILETIRRLAAQYRLLFAPEQVIELRALKVNRGFGNPCTFAGYFEVKQLESLAKAALDITKKAKGVYFTLNPVNPELLARRNNRLDVAGEGELSKDKDVLRRHWLLIDADPVRDPLVSATDDEKAEALKAVQAVRDFLQARQWPQPILADSGNGNHLLYRVELPADDGGIVERILKALAHRFDTDRVKIDQKVFNPSRICKLPGTKAKKGDSVRTRPHRIASILEVPAGATEFGQIVAVPRELLEALAAEATAPEPTPSPRSSANSAHGTNGQSNGQYTSRLDVARWLNDRGIPHRVKNQPDGKGRIVFVLTQCPFDSGHGNPDSCVMQDPAGKMSAQCFHNSCQGRGWQEFKERIGAPEGHHYEPPLTGRSRGNRKRRAGKETKTEWSELVDADDEDDRPLIFIGVDEARVNDEAIAALTKDERLFQRANMLVHVLRDTAKTRTIIRPPGSPRIAQLPNALLREMMASAAQWEGDDGPAHPPTWSVAGVAARGVWNGIRALDAVVEAPTLRPDGTILAEPGWDAATGLLYEPRIPFPPIPDRPTRETARDAADVLLELVRDFPFAATVQSMAWLAALLTPFARFAFAGPAPLFLFTANTAGSGKTLLASLIAEIAEGREIARTPYPAKDEEMAKTITAVALAGDKLMLLDNIDSATPFGCASLDAALTGTTWKQRILGVSQMTPELPLFTVWFGSGNNVALRGDVHRRIIPCRLETPEERPEERSGFRHPNLIEHVHQNRASLVAAALTILRAYFTADKPAVPLSALGSFEGWSATVRAAVAWVTDHDPAATREGVTDADETLTVLAAVLQGWSELPGGAGAEGVTVTEAFRFIKGDQNDQFVTLRDALMSWSRRDDLPSKETVGCRLRRLRGRVLNGRALQGRINRDKVTRWRVTTASQRCGAGDAGDCGG